jgi:hypothetical protein
VDWVEGNMMGTLTICRLPRANHKHRKSTNMLEWLNEEIKRRTPVVRISNPVCALSPSFWQNATRNGWPGKSQPEKLIAISRWNLLGAFAEKKLRCPALESNRSLSFEKEADIERNRWLSGR